MTGRRRHRVGCVCRFCRHKVAAPSGFGAELFHDVLRSTLNSWVQQTKTAPWCDCEPCTIARARDVTPVDVRQRAGVQVATYRRLIAPADQGKGAQLDALTARLFQKPAGLLTELEALAVIAHIERGELGEG